MRPWNDWNIGQYENRLQCTNLVSGFDGMGKSTDAGKCAQCAGALRRKGEDGNHESSFLLPGPTVPP